jgi:hypothetical protein
MNTADSLKVWIAPALQIPDQSSRSSWLDGMVSKPLALIGIRIQATCSGRILLPPHFVRLTKDKWPGVMRDGQEPDPDWVAMADLARNLVREAFPNPEPFLHVDLTTVHQVPCTRWMDLKALAFQSPRSAQQQTVALQAPHLRVCAALDFLPKEAAEGTLRVRLGFRVQVVQNGEIVMPAQFVELDAMTYQRSDNQAPIVPLDDFEARARELVRLAFLYPDPDLSVDLESVHRTGAGPVLGHGAQPFICMW